MSATTLSFDHVHLVSTEPDTAAQWYVDKLGASLVKRLEVKGAPQIYVKVGDAMVVIRGRRPGESPQDKAGLEWGVDHFGLAVAGDLDGYCDELKAAGVTFTLEPTDAGPATRIAFFSAPDGVNVELVQRGGA